MTDYFKTPELTLHWLHLLAEIMLHALLSGYHHSLGLTSISDTENQNKNCPVFVSQAQALRSFLTRPCWHLLRLLRKEGKVFSPNIYILNHGSSKNVMRFQSQKP